MAIGLVGVKGGATAIDFILNKIEIAPSFFRLLPEKSNLIFPSATVEASNIEVVDNLVVDKGKDSGDNDE